jgi:hypothetical protein
MNQFIRHDHIQLIAEDFWTQQGKKLSTAGITPSPLLTNLLAYYTFNDKRGNILHDWTRQGRNLTWQGTLGNQWGNGFIDGAGVFNGTNNGIKGTIANPLLDGSFTFLTWVFFTAFGDTDSLMQANVDVGGNFWGQLYVHDYAGIHHARFILDDQQGHQSPTPLNTPLATGQWYHIAAVRDTDAGQVLLYLNGALEGSAADTSVAVPTYSDFYLGQGVGSQFITAEMDEAGLYNRALLPAEIAKSFNNGKGLLYPFLGY